MENFSLVLFTVFLQSAVGLMLITAVWSFADNEHTTQLRLPIIVSAALVTIGGLASITHLGQPLRAFNSLRMIGSSPISNEILATGLFAVIVFSLLAIYSLSKPKIENVRKILIVSTISGIALIAAISTVYQIETVPAWNTPLTTISMFMTAAIVATTVAAVTKPGILFNSLFCAVITLSVFTVIMTAIHAQGLGLLSGQALNLLMAKVALIATGGWIVMTQRFHIAIPLSVVILGELSGRIAFFQLL